MEYENAQKQFEARPVISIEDAVRVELEAIAWRDGLKRKGRLICLVQKVMKH